MAVASLDSLQRHIVQQESDLHRLRRQLEQRRNQLASLERRKDQLQTQLKRVDAQIAAVTKGTSRASMKPSPVAPKRAPVKPAPRRLASSPGGVSLPELIVAVIREAGRALALREMVAEIKRRGFQSTSQNFAKLLKVRVYELRKKGVLRRAPDQKGFVLGKVPKGTNSKAAPAKKVISAASVKKGKQ
jgi:hypothetical protein